jgi:flagellar hook-associated protein 1 FlgK
MPLNSIFHIGRSALLAHQATVQTASNNVANVNTVGYSRRETVLRSLTGEQSEWGEVGRGVVAQSIMRYRDRFLDDQVRTARNQFGEWSLRNSQMEGVDAIFAEVDDNGLGARMDEFFNAWQDLANAPQDSASRSNLREKSLSLIDVFHNLDGQLDDRRQALREQIESTVTEINAMTRRVAELNDRLRTLGVESNPASSLLDERDAVIDRLSELVDVEVLPRDDNTVSLYIDSKNVVDTIFNEELSTRTTQDGDSFHIEIEVSGVQPISNLGGKLGGLVELNNETLPGYSERLDALARSLVEEVNGLHRGGYNRNGTTALDFFDPTQITAGSISLSSDVESDLNNIAAGATDALGDNAQALAIAGLKNQAAGGLGATLNDYYASLIAAVGTEAARARDSSAHFQVVHEQLIAQRESVQGVSLDEEMTNLIRFQHAYEAAARIVQTADELMQTVLNMV